MRLAQCLTVNIWPRRFLIMRGIKAYSLKGFEWESSSLDSLAMQKLEDQFLTGLADSYDRQPYFSNVFPWSAPGYIRAAAHLYGIQSPPVANARILELGCAAGGNCIPIASLYPDAQVVGVDISARQIAAGQRVIEQAGLTNIRLLNQCFSRLPTDLGKFDYIIAHGVWSWVPEVVQQARSEERRVGKGGGGGGASRRLREKE